MVIIPHNNECQLLNEISWTFYVPSGRSRPEGSLTHLKCSFIFLIQLFHPATEQLDFPLLDVFHAWVFSCFPPSDICDFSILLVSSTFGHLSHFELFQSNFSTKCVPPQRSVVHRSFSNKILFDPIWFWCSAPLLPLVSFILSCNPAIDIGAIHVKLLKTSPQSSLWLQSDRKLISTETDLSLSSNSGPAHSNLWHFK